MVCQALIVDRIEFMECNNRELGEDNGIYTENGRLSEKNDKIAKEILRILISNDQKDKYKKVIEQVRCYQPINDSWLIYIVCINLYNGC